MITTFFDTYPSKYYSTSFDNLLNDTLKFVDYCTSDVKYSNYKLSESDGNLIFKCLMPGVEQDQLDINIKNRQLEVKTSDLSDIEFSMPFNNKINFQKDIDTENSFAKLDKGILTITMPLKGGQETTKIKFK